MLENLPVAVGEALGDVRAGLTQTLFHAVDLRQGMAALTLIGTYERPSGTISEPLVQALSVSSASAQSGG